MLDVPADRRVLPSALLSSDDTGARLWRELTRLPEYYQTRDEIALLEAHGAEIVGLVPRGCYLIDAGSGYAIDALHFPPYTNDLLG